MISQIWRCAAPFLAVVALLWTSARAANYVVADNDVDGLINAIHAANTNAGPDTIILARNGRYTLWRPNHTSDWTGPTGLPQIASEIVIEGQGATIERYDDPDVPNFRILLVNVSGSLTLRNVVIMQGRAEQGRAGYAGGGGGIRNDGGVVFIDSSTIANNSGSDILQGTGGNAGGGIYNNSGGALKIVNSTISHNTGYGGRTGGGIHNETYYDKHSTTVIVSSTIFENRADGPQGMKGRGDAISHFASGPGGGGITVRNSVIASPTNGLGRDCVGGLAIRSDGGNIASDASCNLQAAGDSNDVDPMLSALMMNGGLTPTHAPAPQSPAVDAVQFMSCIGPDGASLRTDQRGFQRPVGPGCDIGSIEGAPIPLCCAPFDASDLAGAFRAETYSGGDPRLAGKYRLVVQSRQALSASSFGRQMQRYIDYAHALDPAITTVSIELMVYDMASCRNAATAPAYEDFGACGAYSVSIAARITWTAGRTTPTYDPTTFFNFVPDALDKGGWVALTADTFFNNNLDYDPPGDCQRVVYLPWKEDT